MRQTYTYAVLDVSPSTYREVREKLVAAGYAHAFHEGSDGEVIDMHGIAVRETAPADAAVDEDWLEAVDARARKAATSRALAPALISSRACDPVIASRRDAAITDGLRSQNDVPVLIAEVRRLRGELAERDGRDDDARARMREAD